MFACKAPGAYGGAGPRANAQKGVPPRKIGQGRSLKGFVAMSRTSLLSSPLLLGFDEIERLIDRVGRAGSDGYPPYNIERIAGENGDSEKLRITLAVAGFKRDQLEIAVEDKQLTIRGKQEDDKLRQYLHRGIAARQFQRTFVLADGIEVRSADLEDGLLSIDLVRREPKRQIRRVEIGGRKTRL
jgi:HSP20 family molecular chaperone IbpA